MGLTSMSIEGSTGEKLHARYWSVNEPRAAVFLSHGLSEHLEVYNDLAKSLNSVGLYVFGHDHLGHGRSEGKRAYIDSVYQFVDDVILHCRLIMEKYPDLPLFIVGHSMGGMIALCSTLRYPDMFKGLVLMGPLIIPGRSIGPFDFRITTVKALIPRIVLTILDTVISPEFVLGYLDRAAISRDEEEQRRMAEDELRWHRGCKVRMILAFIDCMEDNHNLMEDLRVPFLCLHSDADKLCNVQGSRLLIERARVEDKTLIEFPGASHHLYRDLIEVREKSIADTVAWINNRC